MLDIVWKLWYNTSMMIKFNYEVFMNILKIENAIIKILRRNTKLTILKMVFLIVSGLGSVMH
jgi:hypothetical protein